MAMQVGEWREASDRTTMLWIIAAALAGWVWLAVTLMAVLSTTDAARLGPGMALLDRFSALSGLPPDVRLALARLCTTSPERNGSVDQLLTNFAMWLAMVLAMMVPGAAPALTLSAQGRRGTPAVLPVLAGYLVVWTLFAVAITLVSVLLAQARAIDGPMGAMVSTLAATTLLAAGLYQVTPFKRACLDRCRFPARLFGTDVLTPSRQFARGFARGLDCLGCCWALMAAMLAVGIMNVVWMVGLTAAMSLEKALPGDRMRWIIAGVLIALAILTFGQSPAGLKVLRLA